MKAGILFGTILFGLSLSANACPNLMGIYDCYHGEQIQQLLVRQQIVEGVTRFTFNDIEIIADLRERPFPKTPEMEQARYQAQCFGQALEIRVAKLLLDLQHDLKKYGDMKFTLLLSRNGAGDLHQGTQGEVNIDGKGTYPIKESTLCLIK